ncbi:unnamed protein product [Nesidiocoris tenuis]|uniref:Uncharacterized protein n=1 Tax=Nesidiocoris tenuis TaxID=355587 RepID=A0A6H5G554_9HEMI|nr:unnamed protein product [Nesidiocoris tenuis]CAA9997187.1 unnamed protein product [Nesidiocoris tenuis]
MVPNTLRIMVLGTLEKFPTQYTGRVTEFPNASILFACKKRRCLRHCRGRAGNGRFPACSQNSAAVRRLQNQAFNRNIAETQLLQSSVHHYS